MRENRTSGSVRGALGNGRSYRERPPDAFAYVTIYGNITVWVRCAVEIRSF